MAVMLRVTAMVALCTSVCAASACASGAGAPVPEATPTPNRPEDELKAFAEGGTFSRYGQKVVITIASSGNRTISAFLPGAKAPWIISKELTNGDAEEMEDRNGDGVWDTFRTLQHNAAGYHSLQRIDNNRDNTPDEIIEEDVNAPKHERIRKRTHYFRGDDGSWQSTVEPAVTTAYP